MGSDLIGIRTNIITGFLGVGKTTAVLNLLRQKPEDERWAVLVNEFGEVGIDGSLFKGSASEQQDIFIREVPGGCMCCAAGLPMQIALNMLLSRAKPQRLLIEPTGLGHPKEVMAVLTSGHYQTVLDLRSTITLVDARKISDSRYTENSTFNQQLEIADVVVANKADQYDAHHFAGLVNYLEKQGWASDKTVHQTQLGRLLPEWLEAKPKAFDSNDTCHTTVNESTNSLTLPVQDDFPECGYLVIPNQGEGFHSLGLIFKPGLTFQKEKLYNMFLDVKVERLKGVFITNHGVVGFNKVDDVLTEQMLDDVSDSRVEFINDDASTLKVLEQELLSCISS